MLSWIPIQPFVPVTSRIYAIWRTASNESIINVMINGNAINTTLVERRESSIGFVEALIPIISQVTNSKISVTNVNIRQNITNIYTYYLSIYHTKKIYNLSISENKTLP